jgi:cytochrome c oxidase cbb3-type subunit I/II
MYWSGIAQSLMWKQFTPEGMLQYPNFLETTKEIIPMYMIRATGGTLFLTGVIIMIYNLYKTAKLGTFTANESAEAPTLVMIDERSRKGARHRFLEKKPVRFALLATVVVLIGGLVEIVPTFIIKSNIPTIYSVKPYSPLELQGRDIYVREGCNTCHSQMIRPFRSETERYGEYSKAGEFVYDHPFLWGSKRTGPDLHREGMKYPNVWHYLHMDDPRSISPGSIMPAYPWLFKEDLDISNTEAKINALRKIGVPYPFGFEKTANDSLMRQADVITADLQKNGAPADSRKEIIALIAYLQRIGTDIQVNKTTVK